MPRRADELLSGSLPLVRTGGLPAVPRRRPWADPHVWALLAIVVLGGGLRFFRLTEPPLWNDETLVFWRVCGTYGQMLGPLHTDGFPPLHYSLYWLIGHPVPIPAEGTRAILGCVVGLAVTAAAGAAAAVGVRRERAAWVRWGVPAGVVAFVGTALVVTFAVMGAGWLVPRGWVPAERTLALTPFVMRFVPAAAGTLTVPAMYFLARQLLPRGASLVAALVTACSAFMLFYSRDAKMYPDAWLLVTVNVGCLLWWFRTGVTTAWLAWVASGCGMVGLHYSTAAVPAVSVLYLLTQRRLRWPTGLLFLAGLCLIGAGPAGYVAKFNVWSERVEAVGWQASGLGWVAGEFGVGERDGPEHVGYTAAAFLAGYEWPADNLLKRIEPALQQVPQAITLAIAVVLAAAVLPWPLMRAAFRPARQAARDAAAPEPAWRVWLWLGAWIAVPAYFCYCHSVDGFVSPRAWVWEAGRAVSPLAWAAAGGSLVTLVAAAVASRPVRPMLGRVVTFWLATATLFGLCLAVFAWADSAAMDGWFAGRPWQPVWLPRYLGFVWPAVGVGTAALLVRLPTAGVRAVAVAFFCLANLFVAGMRLYLWTEPPIDTLAADVWAAQDPRGDLRTYSDIRSDGIFVAGTSLGIHAPKIVGGRYYLQMLSDRQPMSPDLFERSLSDRVADPYVLRAGYKPGDVWADLKRSPGVRRVVIWTQVLPGERLGFDPYRKAVPAGFRLATEAVYPVREPWAWREYWRWVRREYDRPAAAKR